MYLKYVQILSTTASQGWAAIAALIDPAVLAKCTHCEIMVDTQHVRYTMTGDAPLTTKGMLFLTTEGPKTFLIEDLKRIAFINGPGGAGNLNIHFFAGRDI